MSAYLAHKGVAVLRLPSGGEWKVYSDAVEFECVGSDERQMGPESIHEATYYIEDRDNAPGIKWSVSEYPIGALNFIIHSELNGAKLVSDFDFSMEHEPEPEDF